MHPLRLVSNPDLARRKLLLAMGATGCAGAGLTASLAGCSGQDAAPAPTFDYTLLDGRSANSAALRGQVLLLNFWATSCAVCVAEMPALVATHQLFGPRGLQTLAVAMQYDPPAYVSHFAQTRQLPFGVVIDNTGAIARGFGNVAATPTYFVINQRGAVAKRWVGPPDFKQLHALLEKLLSAA